jgi:precorrin-3B synthase
MSEPIVQGWCPGAFKPMMSGDGLVVRIRPLAAEISARQAKGTAEAAQQYGNGFIDLTNRANLQIRGVSDDSYPKLMQALNDLSLLDSDPVVEPRRNIVLTPFYETDDLSHRIYKQMVANLHRFPDFPGKFGFAIDCSGKRILTDIPADIRFETAANGTLILRAEGADTGFAISEETAVEKALELVNWFLENRPATIRRMPKLLEQVDLPEKFQGTPPTDTRYATRPGLTDGGCAYAVPFGQMAADDLATLAEKAPTLRITPWRSVWLRNAATDPIETLISSPDDPRLRVDSCAGMPYCPQATVETRRYATKLAGRWPGHLHVSGCAKGCTHPASADVVLVGRNGRFDLVMGGTAWDEPSRTGLSSEDILTLDLT